MKRLMLVALAACLVAIPAVAGGKASRPKTIALPAGFQPEGIASAGASKLYVGSIPSGAVWRGDARTGKGAVLVPPHEGRSALGLKVRGGRIFVAGGATGNGYVYRAKDGADIASYRLAPEGATDTFINDVTVTSRAAYFTDSRLKRIYKLPFGRKGKLPRSGGVKTIHLKGDITYGEGFNANGIAATKDGKRLIIVHTDTGELFRVDPSTGRTRTVAVAGGRRFKGGDGLLLRDGKLYVAVNTDNLIAVLKIDGKLTKATFTRSFGDPDFDVPTTIAYSGGFLYAVNARFATRPTPATQYDVVRVAGS